MKQKITTEQKGEVFLLLEALLWSFFPIVTILTFNNIPPLYAAAFSTLIAAVFFIIYLSYKKEWKYILVRSAWFDILIATALIGVVVYALLFVGLQFTSAGNASIIGLTEVFFTLLILGKIFNKEKNTKQVVVGSILMVTGALLVLFHGSFNFNKGDILIMAASAVAPIGNYFSKRARAKVSSEYIMTIRSILAGLFLLLMAYFFSPKIMFSDFTGSLPFLLINGILLLGISKIFWLEAIHRINISKAIALASIIPIFTLIFAFFILKEIPTIYQIVGLIPIMAGVWLLTDFKQKLMLK